MWAWRLGIDVGWLPVAVIPGTSGGNQAGAIKGDGLGNLYVSIGNQVTAGVNGIWQISNPLDMFGSTKVRQVLAVTDQDQVYGFELEVDTSSKLPTWLWLSRKNRTYTTYSFDLSTLGRIPWSGDATTGSFEEASVTTMEDIYHRGSCLFGCATWFLLGINRDPTTGILWLNYKNGDAEHYIAPYKDGKVDDGCYFYAAMSAVTHPKFSTLLGFGGMPSGRCPCFTVYVSKTN